VSTRHVFVADLHLRRGECAKRDAFIDMVEGLSGSDVHLHILGDLFDLWLGSTQLRAEPEWEPMLDAMGRLVAAGGRLAFYHGNRDFCMGDYLTRTLGAETVRRAKTLDVDGQRLYLTHGDLLCTGDQLYHLARRVSRWPVVTALWWCLPMRWKYGCSGVYRNVSHRQDASRRPSRHGISPRKLRELSSRGVDVVVCGHIHQQSDRVHRYGERRLRVITLPVWRERGAVLEYADGVFRMDTVDFA